MFRSVSRDPLFAGRVAQVGRVAAIHTCFATAAAVVGAARLLSQTALLRPGGIVTALRFSMWLATTGMRL